ncbi:jmjC domain-containing protein 8 isoform X1 [Triplophysa rosa]|uniref:JmjC domain-containing protein 8 n=1 Tax=Triplophysa rosa TaxID=992332 RepID=A0A9W7WLH9_TRIRA|nr:jmjC domain-containing protein 8 isoform X1 [Triplophysa rosa]KAI7803670.1 putative jmjC domain-containing protein 8 [Triplophysa rosa]
MLHSLRVLLVLLLIQLQSSFESTKGSSVDDGEWAVDFSMGDEGECNIEIRDVNSITYTEFIKEYAYTKPVILRGLTDNSNFRFLCSKSNLLKEYGEKTVRLSTANTHSYNKVDVQFEEFVKFLLTPQSEDALGSDTLYFFGDNNFTEWHSLFEEYKAPPYSLPHMSPAYSFGIAGPGTGVPFHWHGPGFSEVIYGRKRWFLYPPDQAPEFQPNHTTLSWVSFSYPNLELHQMPVECTIRPGEVLYFPDRWWHATLNLDTSVFISTFLG